MDPKTEARKTDCKKKHKTTGQYYARMVFTTKNGKLRKMQTRNKEKKEKSRNSKREGKTKKKKQKKK